ncbi:EF-hand domain-containing protein, partial [Alteromonas sp. ZYF713]|nr:EF-hand domain-containing protein [Alteromonas sp. ZYF713]
IESQLSKLVKMVHLHIHNYRPIPEDNKREMKLQEFEKFLETLDTDRDGCISSEELRQAIRKNGGWFATWKAKRAVKSADVNGNGVIDKGEISKLVALAEKELNVRIVSY